MSVPGTKQLYKYDVIDKDEAAAIERARARTGDNFVSILSISTGKIKIINR